MAYVTLNRQHGITHHYEDITSAKGGQGMPRGEADPRGSLAKGASEFLRSAHAGGHSDGTKE